MRFRRLLIVFAITALLQTGCFCGWPHCGCWHHCLAPERPGDASDNPERVALERSEREVPVVP